MVKIYTFALLGLSLFGHGAKIEPVAWSLLGGWRFWESKTASNFFLRKPHFLQRHTANLEPGENKRRHNREPLTMFLLLQMKWQQPKAPLC